MLNIKEEKQEIKWLTITEMRTEIEKVARFPIDVCHLIQNGFGEWVYTKVGIANDIDEYLYIKVKKLRVPIEDAVHGLARVVGLDVSHVHVSKVRK